MPTPHTSPTRTLWMLVLCVCLGVIGCGDAAAPGSEGAPAAAALTPDTVPAVPNQHFERSFIFSSTASDSAIYVPWVFRSVVRAGGVTRHRAAWLRATGGWELLVDETEDSPPTRAPWRVLPGPTLRVLSGPDESIEGLIFRDLPRELETRLGTLLVEWSGPLGESIRIHRGTTVLPSGPVQGFVVDFSRNWEEPRDVRGDWLFLHAGDVAQLFLLEVPRGGVRSPARYRGWSRIALRESQWPMLTVEWSEVRGFEPARRDIPARWTVTSADGEVEGEFSVVASHLAALPGVGPILPVSAIFEVSGTIRIEGESFPVTGLARHTQR